MITTIQEGDILAIQLIHTLSETEDYIEDATVKSVDMVGLVVSLEVWIDFDQEANKVKYATNDVFVPWSNIMAAHVYRGEDSGADTYKTLVRVIGDHEMDDDGDVISIQERRHQELLKAQSNVTYYNGDW